jgi:uncharacterized protein (DUF885 family)
MHRRLKASLLPIAATLLWGPVLLAAESQGGAEATAKALDELVESYYEEHLRLNPLQATEIGDARYNDRFEVTISPEWRARAERLERGYLERLARLDHSKLQGQDALTYEVFRLDREENLEGFRYPSHLLPFNQFRSTPNSFAQLGSGKDVQPFETVRDYENFLRRIDGLVAWTDQAIVNMREGIPKGYTQPCVLMERAVPQLEAHVVAKAEDSIFWMPGRDMPASFPAAHRERLTTEYRKAIEQKLVPGYRRLRDFVRDEYLPRCRETVGWSALPDGQAWYAYRVRDITTTDYTPEQIHAIGLAEVARIHGEIRKVMDRVGFKGELRAFIDYMRSDPKFFFDETGQLIAGYREIKGRVDPQLPKLFEILPRADYEVRPVEAFREKTASGGSYQSASEDGSRPGVFYANTYNLKARPKWAMEALSLHEGNPGHHLQITIAQEQPLPRFRRFGRSTAYTEGWGLYAESLGPQFGLYQDPYSYFGMLQGELWRAIRLVVDTGLHAKGWTRQQVLDYMEANGAAAETQRIAEAERYMAIPGQALAYKLGQIRILELRARAQEAPGPRFDLRKFHTVVLQNGPLPLDVLDAEVDRWIEVQQK